MENLKKTFTKSGKKMTKKEYLNLPWGDAYNDKWDVVKLIFEKYLPEKFIVLNTENDLISLEDLKLEMLTEKKELELSIVCRDNEGTPGYHDIEVKWYDKILYIGFTCNDSFSAFEAELFLPLS